MPAEGLMSAPALRRDFSWADYRAAWEGLAVQATAFVQVRPEEEGLAEARTISEAQAVVAGCVLEDPLRRAELDELARLPRVRGVRRGTQFHPDPLYLARPEMVEGYRRVAELGLVGQVCVKYFQLEAVHHLASALPQLKVIVDHLGKPPLNGPAPVEWREWMSRLATLPNVFVKLAPSPQSAAETRLDAAAAREIVAETVWTFGYDRCLFSSNWPVSTLMVGYTDWVELVCAALPGASDAELDALFFATGAGLLLPPAPGA